MHIIRDDFKIQGNPAINRQLNVRWNDLSRQARVRELSNAGFKSTQIADILGVTRVTVWRDLKALAKNEIAQGADTLPGRDHNQQEEAGGSPHKDTSGETTTNGGIQ